MRWNTPDPAQRLLFSPLGLLLATCETIGERYAPKCLRVWDPLRGHEVARLDISGDVLSAAFISERSLAVVESGRCRFWSLDAGVTHTITPDPEGFAEPYGGGLSSGTASASGGFVALMAGPTGRILDPRTAEVRHTIRPFGGSEVWFDAMTASGPFLAAVCRSTYDEYRALHLWDAARGKRLRTYELYPLFVDHNPVLALRPDGSRLAAAARGSVRAFGIAAEEELEGFTPFEAEHVHALRYSPEGHALDILCGEGAARVVRLDAATGRPIAQRELPSGLSVRHGALDPSGHKAALSDGAAVEILDLADL